ncbi:MAG TPA: formate dehydrogenase accessory sulfurtransferase FdhD [Candidatus Dormibacteraeota bacterium]|nr:formate dehydrogenase accessory sulfurtransferase FdhD [Candidatus Dormibacteraeota bacterium]
MARPSSPGTRIRRYQDGGWSGDDDLVAAEEPLQLLLDGEPLSIVMRTPGSDLELALGLLFAERVITGFDDVERVRISAEAGESERGFPLEPDLIESNQVDVHVRNVRRRPDRSFLQTSACGVCGATTVESLALDHAPLLPGPKIDPDLLPPLPDRLRGGQTVFDLTGGLHAAGLFDEGGRLLMLREDVGRHNAVDKVVGRLVLAGGLPASRSLLVVSGRAGYEIVQKAVAAGIPLVAAVGAPTSLAVATAERFGMTLVGFLRRGRFNVYSDRDRLR